MNPMNMNGVMGNNNSIANRNINMNNTSAGVYEEERNNRDYYRSNVSERENRRGN